MLYSEEEGFVRVRGADSIREQLERLSSPGGIALIADDGARQSLPVVLSEIVPGKGLVMDLTSAGEPQKGLVPGLAFRLQGRYRGNIVRSASLTLEDVAREGDRVRGRCEFPDYLELLQRRDAFRARLNLGMVVRVEIVDSADTFAFAGTLKDLSVTGCLVEVTPQSGTVLATHAEPLALTLIFPDGSRFTIEGMACYVHADTESDAVWAGFAFGVTTLDQERRLWFFVREIEREAARIGEEESLRLPSRLFRVPLAEPGLFAREAPQWEYPTVMARRLGRLAAYLDALLLALQQGRAVVPGRLSRSAERLMGLLHEDREALLFATQCLHREPPLIQHSLGVAVRLADFAASQRMPGHLCKALAACGMVHDLGKALLPPVPHGRPRFDEDRYRQLHGHVKLIVERLGDCQWLSSSVVEAVIFGINERLDGSGYPAGLRGSQLHELARLAAVVDVVDALGRTRPDRHAWPIDKIYGYLKDNPGRFDRRWVARYKAHFGELPVGTAVRFASGDMGWVLRLDGERRLGQVQLIETLAPAGMSGGEIVEAADLAGLGAPVAVLAPAVPEGLGALSADDLSRANDGR